MFGVLLGVGFGGSGEGVNYFGDDPVVNSVVVGIFELVGGILVGVIIGFFLRLFTKAPSLVKTVCSFGLAYGVVLVSGILRLSGLGFLATITLGSVAGMKWGEGSIEVEKHISYLWKVLQVFLFGLIGALVDLGDLERDLVLGGVVVIAVGLIFRIPTAFSAVCKSGLTTKEKLFVSVVWMAKATVQAALGGVALSIAEEEDMDNDYLRIGRIFLNVAVLCILLTAPVGAVLTALLGPRWLNKATVVPES